MEVVITDGDASVNSFTVKGIEDDIANGGLVKFGVKMGGEMMFSRNKFFMKQLEVHCFDVMIQFANGTTNGGKMVGPPIPCNVSV